MSEIPHSNVSRLIKFSLLVLFGIVSIICALYVIYNAIKIVSFRRRFQNQTLLVLVFLILFNTIFNIPTTFSFFARGYVSPKSNTFCRIWQIFDYIFTACILWCEAIFTLQRYVLIFHPNYILSLKQKLIYHYIPLISIKLYLILFYIFVDLFTRCERGPNFNEHLCGEQCFEQQNRLSIFNWLFNILFPSFIIIFGSLMLLLRVVWTRRLMQRNMRNWSKNWKMIVQLLGIAIIFTIVWLPVSIISLFEMFNYQNRDNLDYDSIKNIGEQFYFVTYLCEMTIPIVALFFWPEVMRKLRRRFRPNAVASITIVPHSTY